jgi:hypothetical protein
MSNTLKINATGSVIQFLERYQIWKDCCNFYKNHDVMPLVEMAQDGIPCFYYNDIKNINSSSSNLIAIDCTYDGVHCYKEFKKYNKQKKYILFCNGIWDTDYHQFGIDYVLIQSFFFLYMMADAYTSPNRFCYYLDKSYNFDCEKPYSFVSTVGNVRNKRTIFVEKLTQSLADKKFILRYSGVDYGELSDHLDVIKFTPGEFDPYINIFPKHYHTVSQSLPMAMYNTARFNIVVETDIAWQNSFFLTEKTIKVLLTGMPFVSVATPNFLANIRALGFETYHSLWDESYDQEHDWLKRFDKIVDLCNNLCDFDWDSHRDQLEKIKHKNQTNFLNLNKLINQEFENFENTIKKLL